MFSTTGGMGKEAPKFMEKLTQKISDKSNTPYPDAISEIRLERSFSLLQSAITGLRGTRKWRTDHSQDLNFRHFDVVFFFFCEFTL